MATNNAANIPTAATGKVLQGAGVGTASTFSTATYPSVATGTGKILRADGTNWVATTATFPDTAGTNGNVLTSNGTNWASTAPAASGLGYTFQIMTTTGNPLDATTYFLATSVATTNSTASGQAQTRFYIPKAGTITACYGGFTCTVGSNQATTLALRLNNTTNTNVVTNMDFSSADFLFSNNALSIAVALGDYIEILLICPTWNPTNPTTVRSSITVYIS